MRTIHRALSALAMAAVASSLTLPETRADEGGRPELPSPLWSFSGILGRYDQAALRRGFLVYMDTCSGCHSLRHVAYRDLSALGVGFAPENIKTLAAQFKIEDGPDEEGKMFRRPARPSDRIVSRFANKEAAQHANKGMYPPDLSLITKARHDGTDYLYAFLIGYGDAPAGVELTPGMYFNRYAPGQQTGMEAVLEDDLVEFDDGTPATVDQMARDVTEFLSWAADPHREVRHSIGSRVVIFLFLLTLMLIALKREIWAHLHEKKPEPPATAPADPAS
ncbi:MAG TPA: cytochrome c1 [Rhodospirillales bacterium]|jgi:cytochrome c1|nr:cytochrome c1 [Rhodospirillales bacterium]